MTLFSLTITLQLLPGDPPGPPHLSLSHQHRRPGAAGAEDMIIFKGQDPPLGDLHNIFNWFLMVLGGSLALQSSTEALLISFFYFFPFILHWPRKCTMNTLMEMTANVIVLDWGLRFFFTNRTIPCFSYDYNFMHVTRTGRKLSYSLVQSYSSASNVL